MVTPAARREAVEQGYEMSERRACSLDALLRVKQRSGFD